MMEFSAVYAIIVAAGRGTRMGADRPKQLLPYGGSTVLETAVRAFAGYSSIDRIIIVSPQDGSLDTVYMEIADRVMKDCTPRIGVVRDGAARSGSEGCSMPRIGVVRGGAERGDSVKAGLASAAEDAGRIGIGLNDAIVLIHDAARPGVTADIIERSIKAMETCRAACAAVPSTDSIRMINKEKSGYTGSFSLKESPTYPIMNTDVVRRELVYRVQTPQTFRLGDITEAYRLADLDGYTGTDDASIAEHAGIETALIEGSRANDKITVKEDIHMAVRTGTGYDVHRLVPGRDLILCGTPIPSKLGLDGHSDADVATHALMDALLGAAGLGDIGRHFPDTDDKYKGADSLKLLAEVKEMLGGAVINNADITIIAQAPKLAPYMDQMKHNIAETLDIPESAVNVKATTEEGLGFTGRGEGIAAIAACCIETA